MNLFVEFDGFLRHPFGGRGFRLRQLAVQILKFEPGVQLLLGRGRGLANSFLDLGLGATGSLRDLDQFVYQVGAFGALAIVDIDKHESILLDGVPGRNRPNALHKLVVGRLGKGTSLLLYLDPVADIQGNLDQSQGSHTGCPTLPDVNGPSFDGCVEWVYWSMIYGHYGHEATEPVCRQPAQKIQKEGLELSP